MKGKRILALCLCLAMLAGSLPAAARAERAVPYEKDCDHADVRYVAPAEASCTRQGTREFWYCGDCQQYYVDQNLQDPVLPGENEYRVTERSFLLPALGHNFGHDGLCQNCGMHRPVYTQVTTLAQFDALHADTSFILVIRDGEKTYGAYVPAFENPCDVDTDGDGIVDALETDLNENGVPDCIELLFADWYNDDMDGDGDIDKADYDLFVADFVGTEVTDMAAYVLFMEANYYDLYMLFEEQAYESPNFVELTMAADGSITLADEGAMEFQMMAAGILGGAAYSQEEFDKHGILETERIRAAWVPNFWIAGDGLLGYHCEGHFMSQYRSYGDEANPGFMDVKNWKLSFREDGSVCLVSTWEDYDDTGALQFVKYTDEAGEGAMTLVGLPESLWADSLIMQNRVESLPVYLYAAEPVYGHAHSWDAGSITKEPTCTEEGEKTYTCSECQEVRTEPVAPLGHDWGDWVYDSADAHVRHCLRQCGVEPEYGTHEWGPWEQEDETHHKMTCDFCQGAQHEEHSWDQGTVTQEPTDTAEGILTYTCTVCGATKTERIPAAVTLGDVNGDGKVNARDARALLRYIAGMADDGEVVEAAADFNGDGRVNARDARELLRFVAGLT